MTWTDWLLAASGALIIAGLAGHVYARRRTKRVLAEVDRMTAEIAASNSRYAEWAVAQAASPAGRVVSCPSEDYGHGHEAWARFWAPPPPPMPGPAPTVEEATSYATEVYAHHTDVVESVDVEEWGVDVATDTDEPTTEVTMPRGITRMIAGGPIVVGSAIKVNAEGRATQATIGDVAAGSRIIGIALEAAQADSTVQVQMSGAASVRVEALDERTVPEIPLDTIFDIQHEVDYPAFEVTTYGDFASGRGRQFLQNGRRETIRLRCHMTQAIAALGWPEVVLLHGREMHVAEVMHEASIDGPLETRFTLRPADIGSAASPDWWTQLGAGTQGARTGRRATEAMTSMGASLSAPTWSDWVDAEDYHASLQTPRRRAPRKATPEPEPSIRPAGGRRFDLEDE